MLILLPPSEGKTAAAKGHPFELQELQFPELNPAREEVLTRPGPHQRAVRTRWRSWASALRWRTEVERNTRLHAEPAAPAHSVVFRRAVRRPGLPDPDRRRSSAKRTPPSW